jgi:steroid delta-isomerase-like uncharacterized protein
MPATAAIDEGRALARRFVHEFWNNSNLSVADILFHQDAVNHDPATPNLGMGPEAMKRLVTIHRTAFPDLIMQIEEMIAERDLVVIRWSSLGTHRGEFRGVTPTGKRVSTTGITMLRVYRGVITEVFTHWDALGVMRQIGAASSL